MKKILTGVALLAALITNSFAVVEVDGRTGFTYDDGGDTANPPYTFTFSENYSGGGDRVLVFDKAKKDINSGDHFFHANIVNNGIFGSSYVVILHSDTQVIKYEYPREIYQYLEEFTGTTPTLDISDNSIKTITINNQVLDILRNTSGADSFGNVPYTLFNKDKGIKVSFVRTSNNNFINVKAKIKERAIEDTN
mgnify:CR=1 FL=1|jgi:hypothetical protein